MIFNILYINQKSLIKNQQSFYHLTHNLMTLSPTRPFSGGARPNKNKILVYIASNNLPGKGRMTPLSSIFKSKLESLKVGN
jgi:hypothetical protein